MKKGLLFAIVIIVCFAACKKANYNSGNGTPIINNNNPSGGYTLASAMSELALSAKKITIDAGTGGTFIGNSGTMYIFPPNAFSTQNGKLATGNVDILVTEYLKKSDMVFSNICPVNNGAALISGGEINIQASQGGQPLSIAPNQTYTANMPMPGTDATGMDIFTGTKDSTSGLVNWSAFVDTSNMTGVYSIGTDTVSIITNQLGFINADKFMNNPNNQTFTVTATADASLSDDSLLAYTLFDDFTGVLPVYTKPSGHVFNVSQVPGVPVHFVIIGTVNGNLYAGAVGATPASGSNYVVNMSKVTRGTLKALIDGL